MAANVSVKMMQSPAEREVAGGGGGFNIRPIHHQQEPKITTYIDKIVSYYIIQAETHLQGPLKIG